MYRYIVCILLNKYVALSFLSYTFFSYFFPFLNSSVRVNKVSFPPVVTRVKKYCKKRKKKNQNTLI